MQTDNLALTVFLFLVGMVLTIKGGDFFVDAASWIAERSGIPKLIIGATIVSLATTMPEMLVSVMAAVQGKVDMSIGNAVGSVTANLGLIMALAVVFMPGVIRRKDYLLKSILMLAASAIIVLCGLTGSVSVAMCAVLLVIFAVYLWDNVHEAHRTIRLNGQQPDRAAAAQETGRRVVLVNIAKFVGGAAAIVLGAQLLVDNGSTLARLAGISERVIGVTLVAIGTSLPELITTITAISKKQSELSVGNILGANILDLTLIMPLSSLISGKPLPVSQTMAAIDLPACLLVGLIATIPALIGKRFARWQGAVLLVVYAGYVVLTCTR
mgnify:FL=1